MNKTMIALVAVMLGALLPVQPAQGTAQLNACASQAVTTVEDFLDNGLPPTGNLKDFLEEGLPEPQLRSEILNMEDDVCVRQCEEGGYKMETGEKEMTCIGAVDRPVVPDVPDIETCGRQELGIVIGARHACLDLPGTTPCQTVEATCDDNPNAPHCSDTEDDAGVGGSHVDCEYTCREANLLKVRVSAHDQHATARGYNDCGGARAECDSQNLGTPDCEGVSPGVTTHSEKVDCHGWSKEAFDSPVDISCSSVDPTKPLCLVINCDLRTAQATLFRACVPQASALPPDLLLALLENVPAEEVRSFVSYRYTDTNIASLWLEVEESTGIVHCQGAWF